MRPSLRIPVATLVVAGMALLFVGCAGNAPPTTEDLTPQFIKERSEQFRIAGRTELADMFSDGVVDADDYDTSFKTFSACVISRGFTITDPVLNPGDGLRYIYELDIVGRDPDVVAKDQTECSADFLEVEGMYTATTPQIMDESLRLAVIKCMQTQDLPIDSEAKSYPQIIQSAGDAATGQWLTSIGTCIGDAGSKPFPELPYIPVGF